MKRRYLMRLKSLWVDGFKNLNDFKIDFKKREGITVLIGNNASGKSNVLEVISAIFSRLYSDKLKELPFKFDLVYTINGLDIRVSKNQEIEYKIKKPEDKSWHNLEKLYSLGSRLPAEIPFTLGESYDYRPSQIIALYSGEELRLWEEYYKKPYFDSNKTSLKNDTYVSKLNMLYVNKYYWDVALLTMYASDVKGLEKIVKSELKTITIQINKKLLSNFIKSKPNNEVNKFVSSFITPELEGDGVENIQSLNLSLDEVKDKIDFKTHTELFNLLCVAKLSKDKKLKLITDLELEFENGITTKDFSEGQKKQILLKLCLEVLSGENSLLLFDEPDAHIHIANKKLIPDILKEHSDGEIILATHSPTLAHSFDNKHLAYIENGKINEDYNTQEKLLNELTGGFMGVSESQLFLQSNKDILIVEGKTDEAYISQALKVLKEDIEEYKRLEFNFLWLGGTDSDTFNKIIENFKPKDNQTIIALFDNDGPGYGCIKKILNIGAEKKDFNGFFKENIHIYLYPKKDNFTNQDFVVEDYFPIKILKEFVYGECKVFQGLGGKFDKAKFSKKCQEDDFEKSNFDGFKTLFDKIIEIKNQS